ncbi:MAG: hypothetical protein JRI36_05310 [Deltaproteobacteria bacterium]|nr:hypothetical protein [Deltaproteobacteria bacterium]
MDSEAQLDELSKDIRRACASDGTDCEGVIEALVSERLASLEPQQRLAALERLKGRFGETRSEVRDDEDTAFQVFSLLLGREVSREDLSSAELLEKLAESLNTVFDMLNELVGVINMTLTGRGTGEETIRQVIGFQIEGQQRKQSLQSYLGQIKAAFLVAQQAYQKAARQKVQQILDELDPEKRAKEKGGGFKFGPLRKAELFDTYAEKFGTVKQWFESGRFMDEFLREFEKHAADRL